MNNFKNMNTGKENEKNRKPVVRNRFGRSISEDTFKKNVSDEDMKKLISEGDEDE